MEEERSNFWYTVENAWGERFIRFLHDVFIGDAYADDGQKTYDEIRHEVEVFMWEEADKDEERTLRNVLKDLMQINSLYERFEVTPDEFWSRISEEENATMPRPSAAAAGGGHSSSEMSKKRKASSGGVPCERQRLAFTFAGEIGPMCAFWDAVDREWGQDFWYFFHQRLFKQMHETLERQLTEQEVRRHVEEFFENAAGARRMSIASVLREWMDEFSGFERLGIPPEVFWEVASREEALLRPRPVEWGSPRARAPDQRSPSLVSLGRRSPSIPVGLESPRAAAGGGGGGSEHGEGEESRGGKVDREDEEDVLAFVFEDQPQAAAGGGGGVGGGHGEREVDRVLAFLYEDYEDQPQAAAGGTDGSGGLPQPGAGDELAWSDEEESEEAKREREHTEHERAEREREIQAEQERRQREIQAEQERIEREREIEAERTRRREEAERAFAGQLDMNQPVARHQPWDSESD
jgi:hypothetical protein